MVAINVSTVVVLAIAIAQLSCSAGEPATEHKNTAVVGLDRTAIESVMNHPRAKAIANSFADPVLANPEYPFRGEPDHRFEQWQLSALIDHGNGLWWWYQQRFFRLAIAEANGSDLTSDWAFRDIMSQHFTRYSFGSSSAETHQSVQRRALGLADTEARRLFVGAIDLSFSSNDECAAAATLTHIDINLTWQHTACPQRTLIAGTGYADSLAGVVHSSLTEQKGVGWISHVFGRVPELSGAVLLESLKTVLPNQQELRVNRTRRRSGRGPVTVTATLLSNGQTRNLDDVQWLEKTPAGALFPESITLVLPELHWQLNLDVPATIADQVEPTLTTAQQHGVLVKLTSLDSNTTGASADSPLAPGVVTLHPRPQP